MLQVSEVNSLGYERFVKAFSNVVEQSPIVAATVWEYYPFKDVDELHHRFEQVLDQLPYNGKWLNGEIM